MADQSNQFSQSNQSNQTGQPGQSNQPNRSNQSNQSYQSKQSNHSKQRKCGMQRNPHNAIQSNSLPSGNWNIPIQCNQTKICNFQSNLIHLQCNPIKMHSLQTMQPFKATQMWTATQPSQCNPIQLPVTRYPLSNAIQCNSTKLERFVGGTLHLP